MTQIKKAFKVGNKPNEKIELASDLRNFEPAFDNQVILLMGLTTIAVDSGEFYYDASDTTTADDGTDTIVTTGGKRWKRLSDNAHPQSLVYRGVTDPQYFIPTSPKIGDTYLLEDGGDPLGEGRAGDFVIWTGDPSEVVGSQGYADAYGSDIYGRGWQTFVDLNFNQTFWIFDSGSGVDENPSIIDFTGDLVSATTDSDPNYPRITVNVDSINVSITASQVTDFSTAVSQEASVLAALAHLPSDGSSHTFIDQDVTTTGTPTFGSLTANGGISFDGGTNYLDDYEEGTWTPTAAAYSGVMTVTAARYTKIGRMCYASASVTFDGTADASTVNLQSVPFTPKSTIIEGGFITRNTTGVDFHLDLGGTNSIRFRDPATNADRTYTQMSTGTVHFTLIYTVA